MALICLTLHWNFPFSAILHIFYIKTHLWLDEGDILYIYIFIYYIFVSNKLFSVNDVGVGHERYKAAQEGKRKVLLDIVTDY